MNYLLMVINAISNYFITGLITTIIILLYYRLKLCFQYWEKLKMPHLKPESYIFGSNFDLIFRRTSFQEFHAELYKKLAPHRYGGYYNFQRPFILIRDPELVKQVLSVEFHKFYQRHNDADGSEPMRLHLFNVNGAKWKALREKLTPAFSPAKIRLMTELMKECAKEMVQVLEKPAENNEDLYFSHVALRYHTDVISTCAFGYRAHTLSNLDLEIWEMSRRIIEPHMKFNFRSLMLAISPVLCKIFKVRMLDKKACDYFTNLVDQVIKYREETKMVRNDFIDILISVKNEELAARERDKTRHHRFDISVEHLTAQSFAFFFAGFSNTTLSCALLELARNKEIQDKLRQEIDEAFEANGGDIDYDCVTKMKYMEQVISETIRSYPGQPVVLRQCMEDYKIPDSDAVIEKGVTVFIPRYGLNHDPEYYPDPDTFDPEHFSDEAKANRHPYAHLLFGGGPRKCIGGRFGSIHNKLGLAYILRHYEVSPSSKMKFPLKYTSNVILTEIIGGIYIRLSKRK